VPQIVRIDDLHVDLEPRGTILITHHKDVPGVVGLLGTLLGEERVNIRRIELGPGGRRERRRRADGPRVPLARRRAAAGVLEKIAKLAPVKSVRLVRL
jgi:D-3-phosphoglycerate dehydrogenase